MGYALDFAAVLRGLDQLLWGLALGLIMGLAGLAVGSAIGIVAALAHVFGPQPARTVVRLYVGLIRNVPILVLALRLLCAAAIWHPIQQHHDLCGGAGGLCRGLSDRVLPGGDDHGATGAILDAGRSIG